MRRLAPWLLALTLLGTAGAKIDRLEAYERDHYTALKVFMTDKERKEFLKKKTPEDRDQWLKEKRLWDRFYQYDEARREAIVKGDVQIGFTYDQLLMAWGKPFDRKRLTGRDAARSELYVYRFEVAPSGAVMVWVPGSRTTHKAIEKYQVDVYVDDQKVTRLDKKDGWK